MIDFFYEESATHSSKNGSKIKYKIFSILSKIFYFASVVWAIFAVLGGIDFNKFLLSFLLSFTFFAVLFGTGFFFAKACERIYVDYDYSILTGTVSFSKIVGNTKRKGIIKIDISSIERIGKPNNSAYIKFSQMPDIIKKTLTANSEPAEGKDFYYIFFNAEGNKHLYVIECTRTFISNLVRFTRNIVLDGDIK